jgi:hypothetical protein
MTKPLMLRPVSVLLLFAAILPGFPAGAQSTVRQSPLDLAEAKDNQISRPLPADANWRDRVRFMNESSSHYFRMRPVNAGPTVLFFPPILPSLGSEIPILPPLVSGPKAPAELAGFVGDLFYPILGERLASNFLSGAMRTRLQAYRSAKEELQAELRAKIAVLTDDDPQLREQQLAAFAISQTPRITELELTAEKLYKDLQWSGPLGMLAAVSDRKEAPPDTSRADEEKDPTQIDLQSEAWNLRSVAFYQEGLSLAQRRLLLESAMELERPPDAESQTGRPIPFSPETARISLPPLLSEPMAAKIAKYLSVKGLLKTELMDALGKSRDAGNGAHSQDLAQLSGSQSSRFNELDIMAEDIRRDLATLPNSSGPPAPPSLPTDIAARISIYRRHKVEVLRQLQGMLAGGGPPSSPAGFSSSDSTSTAYTWLHDGKTRTEVQVANLPGSVEEFDAKQEELIAGLNKELAGIRSDLSVYVRSTSPAMAGKSIDDLLNDFENARQQQELWDKYRDYRDAVLTPGLSPAQRRLLLDGAAAQLALPLPSGENAR